MKISRLLLLTLFLAASFGTCRAKLGETEAQCMARYGSEFEVRDNLGFDVIGDKSASFHFKAAGTSLVLNIVFWNGVAAHESVTSADGAQGIPLDQEQALLDSESAGLRWTKTKTTFHTDRSDNTVALESWLRSDGATAKCWMSGKTKVQSIGEIDLSTREYAAAQGTLDKQDGAG